MAATPPSADAHPGPARGKSRHDEPATPDKEPASLREPGLRASPDLLSPMAEEPAGRRALSPSSRQLARLMMQELSAGVAACDRAGWGAPACSPGRCSSTASGGAPHGAGTQPGIAPVPVAALRQFPSGLRGRPRAARAGRALPIRRRRPGRCGGEWPGSAVHVAAHPARDPAGCLRRACAARSLRAVHLRSSQSRRARAARRTRPRRASRRLCPWWNMPPASVYVFERSHQSPGASGARHAPTLSVRGVGHYGGRHRPWTGDRLRGRRGRPCRRGARTKPGCRAPAPACCWGGG